MRIKFLIDPSARKRDLEEITRSYNLPPEGFKYLQWRNEYTVSKFFYTWKMIEDFFKTNLQVHIRYQISADFICCKIRYHILDIWYLDMFAGYQQDGSPLLLSSQSFPPVCPDRSQPGPAECSQHWPPSGHQLRVLHLTSLHGKPGQDKGDPGQVCRQGHLPDCLHSGLVSWQ